MEQNSVNLKDSMIWSYQGDFGTDAIARQMEDIESKLFTGGFAKSSIKKIIRVFIELAQNVQIHGGKNNGLEINYKKIEFETKGNQLTIQSHNLLDNSKYEAIKNKIEAYNNSSKEDLDAFFVNALQTGKELNRGGAGIGLIEIMRKTQTSIQVLKTPVDSKFSVLSLKIIIK